ncbi:MAG: MmcB family DNA repair protein [Rubellimicrobium sp.]|nr:MmcB family DNA repair protein [Rubellimicrobium sp.]
MPPDPAPPPPRFLPGTLIARGVCRYLLSLDIVSVVEFVPARGLRLDILALGPEGEFWAIECKSGPADFRSDRKWQGYLPWADRFFWAVTPDFPLDLLPAQSGVILADGHGAGILRDAPRSALPPARRRALMQRFARHAALRAHAARDPDIASGAALDDPG